VTPVVFIFNLQNLLILLAIFNPIYYNTYINISKDIIYYTNHK